MYSLRRQHPVKGVFVIAGKESGSLCVFRRDGKQLIARRRDLFISSKTWNHSKCTDV